MFGTSTDTITQDIPVVDFEAPHVESDLPLNDEPQTLDAPEPRGRDYCAHVQSLFDVVPHKHPGCWTGTELASVTVPCPQHGDRWGAWHFDAERLTLDYKPLGAWQYEIDLERVHDSASLLDWIFQVQGKTWASAQIIRDLLNALDDIFEPQANLCSWGMSKHVKATEFLTKRLVEGK